MRARTVENAVEAQMEAARSDKRIIAETEHATSTSLGYTREAQQDKPQRAASRAANSSQAHHLSHAQLYTHHEGGAQLEFGGVPALTSGGDILRAVAAYASKSICASGSGNVWQQLSSNLLALSAPPSLPTV